MIKKNARFNYLICIYLIGIIFFSLFRIVETVAFCIQSESRVDFGGLYGKALLMGLRFDTVVSCYVLALPLVMMIVGEMARICKRWYYAIAHCYTMTLYTICFFACAADIPYFCYFFNRLDVVALSWAEDFGTSAGMILGEPRYWLYLLLFVAVTVGWWLLGKKIFRKILIKNIEEKKCYCWSIPLTAVLLVLWFFGQRGTVTGGRPVRVSTAYFSANPFINQIGLNPTFTFLKSLQESGKDANQTIDLIDIETARKVYEEERIAGESISTGEWLEEGTNVIIVLMESMSAEKTCLSSTGQSLTSCLDSLMEQSLTFDCWSAGIHTYNGIYSTLYGQPALLARHSMRQTPLPRVCGLPQALEDAGYSTTFFVAHNADFDNLLGFLTLNGMQRVVEKKDYPEEEYVNTWGPSDHVLFDHLLEHCDSMALKGPFFASVMTITDHGPYVIPKGTDFKPKHKEIEKQVIEYADWSIGRFIRMAATKPWFEKTLFVFVADHGAAMDKRYDMPLSYNHVPLLFYAPGRLAPAFPNLQVLQIDIAPTILGMLNLGGGEKMLGLDFTRFDRKYAYFCADDKIGVVDGEWFYLYRVKQEGRESLYRYKDADNTRDYIETEPERAAAMRRHAFGMIQMGQQMILDGTTTCNK